MLGAIKRRWKPKRSSPAKDSNDKNFNKNINNAKNNDVIAMDMARTAPSVQRQIHPVIEGKIHLTAYSDTDNSLPPSPTPNICIERGRIEFVRSPSDGSSNISAKGRPEFQRSPSEGSSCPSGVSSFRYGREFYTTSGSLSSYAEKTDLAKEALEARVRELERLLATEQQSGERERLAVSRLQRQLARRDTAHRDVERERRRRVETETKCREAAVEAQRYRNSLAKLQKEFNRMEENSRAIVHLRSKCDVLTQEKAAITAAYEGRIQTYQNTIGKLGQENQQLRNQLHLMGGSLVDGETFYQSFCDMDLTIHERCFERLRALEEENANLSRDAETAKRQYERCLDDIANQVVRALLSQKGLREEISNLQRRIKDLESQNHALANLLVQRLSRGNDESWMGIFSPSPLRPDTELQHRLPLDSPAITSRLHSLDSLLMLPLQRPRSLHLHTISGACSRRGHKRAKPLLVMPSKKPVEDEGNESPESGNRDEGYSTMSSDVQGLGETSEVSRLGLEDLKEATDEAEEVCSESLVRPLATYSYATCQQSRHVTRSYSDSHLCLMRSPPHRSHLRHNRAAVSLIVEDSGGESVGSGASGWWDQQWLRFDDTRQMEMDQSELENWSLSCEDLMLGLPSIREIGGNWSSDGSSCDGSLPSEETSEPSATVGTDFTRDFYRLVKFESTRSLESSSSRSHANRTQTSNQDRELALQSVLHFIAEQQHYCHTREEEDADVDSDIVPADAPKDCYLNEKDCTETTPDSGKCHSEPIGPCDKLQRTENFSKCLETHTRVLKDDAAAATGLGPVAEEEEVDLTKEGFEVAESLASSLSTPDTVVGAVRISSPLKIKPDSARSAFESRASNGGRETKIPVISTRKLGLSPKKLTPDRLGNRSGIPIPTTTSATTTTSTPTLRTRKDKPSPDRMLIVGQSTLSFHECASSKDVIDELNRMIRKGEEPQAADASESRPLDEQCAQPTGWVHVEREIDFTDPKARANLLDVMLASSGSSEVGSDSGGEDSADYSHLHRLHRFRRHKIAMAGREPFGAVRWPPMSLRPSIVGRDGFYYRFGRQEQDAVAMFDFLEDLSTSSVSSISSSTDALGGTSTQADVQTPTETETETETLDSPAVDEEDEKSADLVSFSDSCADSFSSDDVH